MELEYIDDHEDRAVARLPSQYKGKPRLEALLRSWARQAQALEDAAWQVATLGNLDDATTEQLNILGRIVKIPRRTADDDVYRNHVRARGIVNRSHGYVEEIYTALRLFTPAGTGYWIQRIRPATMVITVGGAFTEDDAAFFMTFFTDMKAGGVRVELIWSSYAEADTFTLDGTAAQALDVGHFASSTT